MSKKNKVFAIGFVRGKEGQIVQLRMKNAIPATGYSVKQLIEMLLDWVDDGMNLN